MKASKALKFIFTIQNATVAYTKYNPTSCCWHLKLHNALNNSATSLPTRRCALSLCIYFHEKTSKCTYESLCPHGRFEYGFFHSSLLHCLWFQTPIAVYSVVMNSDVCYIALTMKRWNFMYVVCLCVQVCLVKQEDKSVLPLLMAHTLWSTPQKT